MKNVDLDRAILKVYLDQMVLDRLSASSKEEATAKFKAFSATMLATRMLFAYPKLPGKTLRNKVERSLDRLVRANIVHGHRSPLAQGINGVEYFALRTWAKDAVGKNGPSVLYDLLEKKEL